MFRTIKHEEFMLGPMENKSIYDLPGIGHVRGERLKKVGIKTAGQLASLYKCKGRDAFESFLNITCGQNRMWTGMTIAALDEYTHRNDNQYALPSKSSLFSIPPKSAAPEKSIPSSHSLQASKVSFSPQNGLLNKMSEQIVSLQSSIRQFGEDVMEFKQENSLKSNQLKKLSEIVEQLQSRTIQYSKANSMLSEKISSDHLKILELNEVISLKSDELTESLGKIQSLDLRLQQVDKGNERTISKLRQQFIELCEAIELIKSRNEEHAKAIKELKEKTNLVDNNQLKNHIIDLRKNIAKKDDELGLLSKKMTGLEVRAQKAEENYEKLNKKLFILILITLIYFVMTQIM